MKRLMILIFSLITLTAISQPKKAAVKPAPTSGTTFTPAEGSKVAINGKYVTDTLSVFYIVTDDEGYLKKIEGTLISDVFVNDYGTVTITGQRRYNTKGELIKPESVYDTKQKVALPPQASPPTTKTK